VTITVSGIPSDGTWFTALGGGSEHPTMIRAREDILGLLPAPGLTTRVMVSWSCRVPLTSGLPSPDDYDELGDFEGTLINFVEEGAILAFVYTTEGVVEYSFYTSDAEWFLERLNEAMSDKGDVPIEIVAEQDPDWSEYRLLMGAVNGEASEV
jgi:hypothetical protein